MTPMKRLSRACVIGLLLAGAARIGAAHTFVLALGEAASATHYVGVICSSEGGYDSDHLLIQILSHGVQAPLVSAQVIKDGQASNTTDPVGGDALAGPTLRLRGGNGLYQVLINKTGPGAVTFTATAHCLDATGTQHTGTDGVVYQYQDR